MALSTQARAWLDKNETRIGEGPRFKPNHLNAQEQSAVDEYFRTYPGVRRDGLEGISWDPNENPNYVMGAGNYFDSDDV